MSLILAPLANSSQDKFDTLYTRGSYILVPVYDSVQQLKEANEKADSILITLQCIEKLIKQDTAR